MNENHVAVLPIAERLHERAVRAMTDALAAAVADEAAVIVIEGEPERFCLGMDFTEASDDPRKLMLLVGLLEALFRCPRPLMAVIDGPALGGGLGVASACDFVLASERATAGLPEALYGLAPAIIRPALLTRLSPQKLRYLLFSCHSRDATEARSLGLFDQVVPVDALPSARKNAIRQLRRANGKTIATSRQWDADALARQLRQGLDETAGALRDPEIREALRLFTSEEGLPWMR
jgi:enoyl-CoA hydratase/carnithine racemase